jgi:pimeloyl-ACP methyl ester carboxylesterase
MRRSCAPAAKRKNPRDRRATAWLAGSLAAASKTKHAFLRLARTLALAYVGVCLLVAGCQNKMLYFPTVLNEPAALGIAKRDGLEPWRDTAGAIIGWRKPNPRAAARLVVFHGNGGCALDRVYYADAFGALDGGATWEVFLFEYPGYGARDGSPGKDAFIATGRAAVDALLAADQRPLFLLGESIGSGTAAALCGSSPEKIAGAVMMIPFARLVEVAQERFPFLPAALLLRDKFDNIAALESYKRPVAFVIAENDEIIGPAQGHKLHDAYAGPKKLIVLPGAGHNDFPTEPGAEWIREVSEFLRAPQ